MSEIIKKSESMEMGEPNGIDTLANMPKTLDEYKKQLGGDNSDGVRDEQDYKEFLAEKTARLLDVEKKSKERITEKSEIISSLENCVEKNKDFYNNLAEESTFLLCLCPNVDNYAYSRTLTLGGFQRGIWHDMRACRYEQEEGGEFVPSDWTDEERKRYNFEIQMSYAYRDARQMMGLLKSGIEKDEKNLDDVVDDGEMVPVDYGTFMDLLEKEKDKDPNTDIYSWRMRNKNGRSVGMEYFERRKDKFEKTKNLVIPSAHKEDFLEMYDGYLNSREDFEEKIKTYYSEKEINAAKEKAHNLMDQDEVWLGKLDELLKKGSLVTFEKLAEADETLRKLHYSTCDFWTEKGYHAGAYNPTFVPRLESYYNIWQRITRLKRNMKSGMEFIMNDDNGRGEQLWQQRANTYRDIK